MQLPLKKNKKLPAVIREPSSLPADRQSPVSSFQYTAAQHFLFPLNVFFVWALSDSLGSLDMVSVIQSGTAWARASRELERLSEESVSPSSISVCLRVSDSLSQCRAWRYR